MRALVTIALVLGGSLAALACSSTSSDGGATPNDAGGSVDTGSSSGSSGADGATPGKDGAVESGADAGPPKIVFLTNGLFGADVGGVTAADGYCQQAAKNANLPGATPGAGPPQKYLAWIAASTTDAPAARFTRSAAGYARTDGALVAKSWEDLTDGTILAPIDRDENGQQATQSQKRVYTNVDSKGELVSAAASCTGWTSTTGNVAAGDATLTDDGTWTKTIAPVPCNDALHFYCFQQ